MRYFRVPLSESQIVRQRFEEQVRRGLASDGLNLVTATNNVVRWTALGDVGWSEIAWSDLDEFTSHDVIEGEIGYFSSVGKGFVWRVYDADQPADLGARLEAAGFTRMSTSELMIAHVDDVPRNVELPSDVSLVSANDTIGIDRLIDVHESVFGVDHSQLRRSLQKQLSEVPHLSELVVAVADDRPVSSARVEFLPDREFASLWGGSTLLAWRSKGLFRAMVAYRADAAERRGYSYLYVTASSESRPIFDRLGFASFGSVVTFSWAPAHAQS